ncbi:phage tail tape measure protein [Lactiplantibacillus modestisalitolerans]
MEKIKGATGTATKATSGMSQRVHQAMSSIGKTTTVAGAAMTAMGVSAMKSYGSFQQSLNKAAVIAGGTSKDIGKLSDMANRMGAELPLSAQDAADAMVAMAQDGASIKTITKEFPAIAQAATATGDDLQNTASVVQQAMNVWGKSLKSPQQAAAILTSTANMSNASISDMQQAIATIGGTASNAGFGMADMSEAIGLMTNKGFTAERASQDLNHAILQMQAPSKKAREEMNSLGLSFTDSSGKMKPFPTILREVAKATDGMSSSQKAAALKTMFNTAGMQAMLPLLASVEDKSGSTTTSWDAYAKAQDKASGSTKAATKFLQDQADEMQQNLGSKIEQVGGNWESLRNKAMEATSGVNSGIVDMINKTLEWAGASQSAGAKAVRSFVGLTPVIGAAMTGLGSFLTVANGLSLFFERMGNLLPTFAKALVNPWTIGLAAVAGFVAILVKAYNQSETFRNAVSSIAKAFSSVFGPAVDAAVGFIKNLWSTITGGSGSSKSAIDSLAKMIGDTLGTALQSVDWQGVFTTAKNVITTVISVVKSLITTVASVVKGFMQTKAAAATWTAIVAVVKAVWAVIKTVVTVLSAIVGGVVKVLSGFMQLQPVQGLFQLIGGAIGLVVKALADGITSIANFVTAMTDPVGTVKNLWGSLTSFFSTLWSGIVTGIQSAWSAVAPIFAPIVNTVKTVWDSLTSFFTGLWAGITTGIQSAWQSITAMLSQLWQNIVTTASSIWNGLGEFFTGLWAGIQTGINNIWTNISSGLSTAWNGIITMAKSIWGLLKDAVMGPVLLILDAFTLDWNQLKSDAVMIWNDIINNAKSLWNGFKSFMSGIWTAVKKTAVSAWNNVKGTLTSVWNSLVSTGKSVWNGFKSFMSGLWNGIKSAAATAWNAIKSAIKNAISSTVSAAKSLWNGLKSFMSGIWNGIKSFTRSAWNSIKSFIMNPAESAASTARSAWSNLRSAASGIWNSLRSTTSSAWNSMKSVIGSAARGMVSSARSAWSGFTSLVSNVVSGIKNTFSSLSWFSLFNAGSRIIDSFRQGMVSAFNSVKSFVSGIAGWIRSHKGPISYDAKLLIPAGNAIMDGLNKGLQTQFESVQKNVSTMADRLAGSVSGVVSDMHAGDLSMQAASYTAGDMAQSISSEERVEPTFIVHNELVGDKIYTSVKSQEGRRDTMNRFFKS